MDQMSLVQSHGDSLINRIVMTVAETRGVDPLDLPPLYDAIDPDALERLFTSSVSPPTPSSIQVHFTYEGHEVTVHNDGDVTVIPESDYSGSTADYRGDGTFEGPHTAAD